MKRVNIYIDETEDKVLDYLSEFYKVSRSEIIRRSLFEMSDRNQTQIQEFTDGLSDLSQEDVHLEATQISMKCRNDITEFAKRTKILSTDNGLMPFDLKDYQENLLEELSLRKRMVVLKSRQLGISSTILLHILHMALYQPNKHIAIVTPKLLMSCDLLQKLKLMYDTVDIPNKPLLTINNKRSIQFDNDTTVFAGTINNDTIRGRSIDYLYVDEAAYSYRETWDNFMDGIMPLMASNKSSKIVIVSNPNGYNHFCKLYMDARTNYIDWHHMKMPWHLDINRDDKWKLHMIASIGNDNFEMEFNCNFNSMSEDNYAF